MSAIQGEAYSEAMDEITRLKARIAELEQFISACRYAGPGGLDRLKQEATKLVVSRKGAQ